MNMREHDLLMQMEESAEAVLELIGCLARVIQRSSKQMRFGRDEVQPGQLLANHQRLRGELLDVLSCIRFLEKSGLIESISEADVITHMIEKQEKIDRMLALSRAQGRVENALCTTMNSVIASGKRCLCEASRCFKESGGDLQPEFYCVKQHNES